MPERRLPIKVVVPREGDLRPPTAGGGGPEPLVPVTPELRRNLVAQAEAIEVAAADWFRTHQDLPVVGKVALRETALAKSHRPTRVFNPDTCPIIGTDGLGELLVRIDPAGLKNLRTELATGHSQKHLHNISTIESMRLFGPGDALSPVVADTVTCEIREKQPLKVELFRFDDETNRKVSSSFREFLLQIECRLERELMYSETLTLQEVGCPSLEQLALLKAWPLVRRVSFFPVYRSYLSVASPADVPIPIEQSLPQEEADYPVVAVVDSGIPQDHARLAPWVIAREAYVAEPYRDHRHGVFVGGLLSNGHLLHPENDDGVSGCRLVDVCIIPNNDRTIGPVDSLKEQILVQCLEDAVAKHHRTARVWNLSLNSSQQCGDQTVSDLASKLDSLSDRYGVVFVVSAGNYSIPPFRSWPCQTALPDRITCPADSIRSLTVGSVAGKSTADSVVQIHDPSPFSRRGPGPSFIIKPDLVHIGGNCTANADCRDQGVHSWAPNGGIVEHIGTSFSTPRVARLLAGVFSSMDVPISSNLAKALVIHSALLPGQDRRPDGDELHYYGYGMPGNLPSILTCSDSSITMVWEVEISSALHFSIPDFPYPECLRVNGRWKGDIWMTLVYDPPLRRDQGFEYCRVNLDASLGVYREVGGKQVFAGQVPPDAQWNDRYEKSRIEHGFKWSPTKVYRRSLPHGVTGDGWRLLVTPLTRSGEAPLVQRFALVVTIADPDGSAEVYNDAIRQLQRSFAVSDLAVKARVRTAIGF